MKNDGLRDEGRLDGSWVEQIGVVAHFAKLHQDVDDRHEVTAGKSFPSPLNGKTRGDISKLAVGTKNPDPRCCAEVR